MNLALDFLDLLSCLNTAHARYLVIGGYAVNAYGHVRATEDLDVWVEASPDNATRVLEALREFGLPPGLDTAMLTTTGSPPAGFRFGRRPVSVDLLTSIHGVDFACAWSQRTSIEVEGLHIHLIGRRHLMENKRASGRPRDLADLEALQRTLP